MIKFIDYFGVKRGISFGANGKYITLTIYSPTKYDKGDSWTIPRDLLQELIDNLRGLEE